MSSAHNRVAVMHGVNLDTLGRRDPEIYGTETLSELEYRIHEFARELGLEASFFQTNHEGEFCEYLHRVPETADAVLVNAGAWTHYSWAIRDALEVAGKPAVEVHISDVENRDDWRSVSVFDGLVAAKISGKGLEGYREGLEVLARGARGLIAAPDSRADRVAEAVADAGLDMAIVGDLVRPGDSIRDSMADVAWLTGFGGTSGTVVIGPEVRTFVTDFRYTDAGGRHRPGVVPDRRRDRRHPRGGRLAPRRAGSGSIRRRRASRRTAKLLEAIGERRRARRAEDLLTDLRRVKDEAEIEAIAAAAALTDEVYAWIEERGLAGRTERDVALAAEERMRELGAEGPVVPVDRRRRRERGAPACRARRTG